MTNHVEDKLKDFSNSKVAKSREITNAVEIYQKLKQEMLNENDYVFPILKFAKELQLKILESDDLGNFKTKSGEQISGFIEGNNIVINKKEPNYRKWFTIAHEIGHYMLGHNDREETVSFRKEHYTDEEKQKEQAANKFAAELLMPEEDFKKVFKKCNEDIYLTARKFNVSPISALFRAKKLLNYNFDENSVW